MSRKNNKDSIYNPVKFLAIGLILTVVCVVILGWQIYSLYLNQQKELRYAYEFSETTHELVHLNKQMRRLLNLVVLKNEGTTKKEYLQTKDLLNNKLNVFFQKVPWFAKQWHEKKLGRNIKKMQSLESEILNALASSQKEKANQLINDEKYSKLTSEIQKGFGRLSTLRERGLYLREFQIAIYYLGQDLRDIVEQAIASRNSDIKETYENSLAELTDFFLNMALHTPNAEIGLAAHEVRQIHERYVEKEKEAFLLLKYQKFDQAKAIIESAEYKSFATLFTKALEKLSFEVNRQESLVFKEKYSNLVWGMALVATVVFLLIIGWVWNLSIIRQKHEQLMIQHRQIIRSFNEAQALNKLLESREGSNV